MKSGDVENISGRLKLSPYQSYILWRNGHKYKIDGLQKRGEVLYAPYRCELSKDAMDYFRKVLFGPRADLIGSDRTLVVGQRGVKLYAAGFYRACDDAGRSYYADSAGHRISKWAFDDVLGL